MTASDLLIIALSLLPAPFAFYLMMRQLPKLMSFDKVLGALVWLDAVMVGLMLSDIAGRLAYLSAGR